MRILAALLATIACVSAVETPPKPAPSKVVVLNLDTYFRKSDEFKARMQQVQRHYEETQKGLKALDEKGQALTNEAQLLNNGSPQQISKIEEIEKVKLDRQLYKRRRDDEVAMLNFSAYADQYQSLRKGLEAYCQERGILLVIQAPLSKVLPNYTVNAQVQLDTKAVLYADPSFDITADFLAWTEAQAGKKPEKGETAPPGGDKPANGQ